MTTISQLYSLYRVGHAEARRISDGGVLRAFEVTVNGAGLSQIERLILELALHDATNGTAMRSRQDFAIAIEQGAELLRSLGLRFDGDEVGCGRDGAPELDEAA